MERDFVEMLSALDAAGAEYLVVGAHALAALREFGAPLFDLTADDLSSPGTVFQIGVVPVRIDLLTSISGVGFEEARAGRVEVAIEGVTVGVLGRRARPQQAGDRSAEGTPRRGDARGRDRGRMIADRGRRRDVLR